MQGFQGFKAWMLLFVVTLRRPVLSQVEELVETRHFRRMWGATKPSANMCLSINSYICLLFTERALA